MADKEQIARLIKKLSERMGTPESEITSALQNANYGKLLNKMDPAQAAKFDAILSDEKAAKQFLNSLILQSLLLRIAMPLPHT